MASIAYLLEMRDKASMAGDWAQVRSLEADLARVGYVEIPRIGGLETAVPSPLETAVLKKGGRPKLPRCEHGKIVGRCVACDED